MREIKFRAWFPKGHWYMEDKGTQMLYDFQDKTACEIFSFNDADEGIIFMQYTGLKDKNGREIYEGDIVRMPGAYGGDYWHDGCDGAVEFDEGEFYAWPQVLSDVCWWVGCEVIGNIYENPELLTNK